MRGGESVCGGGGLGGRREREGGGGRRREWKNERVHMRERVSYK